LACDTISTALLAHLWDSHHALAGHLQSTAAPTPLTTPTTPTTPCSYPDWVVPPSCLDPDTCASVKKNFTDIAQVWRVPSNTSTSTTTSASATTDKFFMSYTFFDGVG
jgi:hypothetical protein